MKAQEFRVWARRQLGEDGECTPKVEVTDNQLAQALDNAIKWFNAYFGLHKEGVLDLIDSQSEYDLSGVSPAMEEVVKVWFPERATGIDWGVLYPGFLDVEGIPWGVGTWHGASYPQTTIIQTMQTLDSTEKFLSSDLGWEFYYDGSTEPVTRLLRVMPYPKRAGRAVYLYRIDPKDIKLEWYKQRDLFLIRDWALAEAKYMLGRIRGKYTSGLPAAGGDRQLDGQDLISEARDDKKDLEDKVLDYQGPIMPEVY